MDYNTQNDMERNAANNESKKGKLFSKIVTSICLGLLFGVFGGLGFFVVQKTTGGLTTVNTVAESQTNIQSDTGANNTLDGIGSGTGTNANNNSQVISASNATTAYTTVITGISDVPTVVESAMPSMVSVAKEYNYVDSTYSFYFGGQSSSYISKASGSGIIVAETDNEYLIVSNNHVVENPISLTVTFADGSEASAYIKGCDNQKDIAVIAVLKNDVSDDSKKAIRIASMGDSDALMLGEQVVAIGNALGYGQSVTTGIVSALNREIETESGSTNVFIQTDAAINPGNSGGALLNMAGEIIGINSNKIGGEAVEGMGYAIPISSVRDIISELMEHSTKIPLADDEVGYIGISLQEVTPSLSQRFSMPVGIYIVETMNGGAAQAAGLQAGDIITGFDGEAIRSYDDLDRTLQYYAAGTTVNIVYQRQVNGEYEEHLAELTLGHKPAD